MNYAYYTLLHYLTNVCQHDCEFVSLNNLTLFQIYIVWNIKIHHDYISFVDYKFYQTEINLFLL